MIDTLILGFDRALRTLSGTVNAARPTPGASISEPALEPHEQRDARGLMRVNHTGEVRAEALYAAGRSLPGIRTCANAMRDGARRGDHLAWTQARSALRTAVTAQSLWYAGRSRLARRRRGRRPLNLGLSSKPSAVRAPDRAASVTAPNDTKAARS
jgi:ubiquinone biosynthesis monooxygenase Coq7